MVSIKFILPRAMLKEMNAVMSRMDVRPSRNALIRAAITAYFETMKAKAKEKANG
jgi:metal-responsive CopG/Arc/MetJ family transcriptional regulator